MLLSSCTLKPVFDAGNTSQVVLYGYLSDQHYEMQGSHPTWKLNWCWLFLGKQAFEMTWQSKLTPTHKMLDPTNNAALFVQEMICSLIAKDCAYAAWCKLLACCLLQSLCFVATPFLIRQHSMELKRQISILQAENERTQTVVRFWIMAKHYVLCW